MNDILWPLLITWAIIGTIIFSLPILLDKFYAWDKDKRINKKQLLLLSFPCGPLAVVIALFVIAFELLKDGD